MKVRLVCFFLLLGGMFCTATKVKEEMDISRGSNGYWGCLYYCESGENRDEDRDLCRSVTFSALIFENTSMNEQTARNYCKDVGAQPYTLAHSFCVNSNYRCAAPNPDNSVVIHPGE